MVDYAREHGTARAVGLRLAARVVHEDAEVVRDVHTRDGNVRVPVGECQGRRRSSSARSSVWPWLRLIVSAHACTSGSCVCTTLSGELRLRAKEKRARPTVCVVLGASVRSRRILGFSLHVLFVREDPVLNEIV